MTVYILLVEPAYCDGNEVKGVYATYELAMQAIKDRPERPGPRPYYDIEEHELIGDKSPTEERTNDDT